MNDLITKICTKCEKEYPLASAYWHIQKFNPSGFYPRCKICRKLDNKKSYEKNKRKRLQSAKIWKQNNPDKVKEYRARERRKPRTKKVRLPPLTQAEAKKKYHEKLKADPERMSRVRATQKLWNENNKEKGKLYKKKAYQKMKEKFDQKTLNEITTRWLNENPEKAQAIRKAAKARRRARQKNTKGFFSAQDVLWKLELQGGLCYYCSKALNTYEADHKIPLFLGGTNWPANICCACQNCNRLKHAKSFWEFVNKPNPMVK